MSGTGSGSGSGSRHGISSPSSSSSSYSSSAVSETVAGFSAGFVSTVVCHPLDAIKTRLQVDRHDRVKPWGGSLDVAKRLFDEARASGKHPLKVIYRGVSPNVVGNTASWGLYFLWYDQFKTMAAEYRGKRNQELTSIDYLLTSGAAGITSAALTNPFWVVKTRMLASGAGSPGAYRGLGEGLYRIATEEGLRGLYRGFLPSLFGVLQAAIQFMAYENLKIWRRSSRLQSSNPDPRLLSNSTDQRQQQSQSPARQQGTSTTATTTIDDKGSGDVRYRRQAASLSNVDYMTLSALSKVFAGALTYPYQVIRSRLQTYDAATVYSSARNAMFLTWQSQGIAGFYRGLVY